MRIRWIFFNCRENVFFWDRAKGQLKKGGSGEEIKVRKAGKWKKGDVLTVFIDCVGSDRFPVIKLIKRHYTDNYTDPTDNYSDNYTNGTDNSTFKRIITRSKRYLLSVISCNSSNNNGYYASFFRL